jgi:hypothetical protein
MRPMTRSHSWSGPSVFLSREDLEEILSVFTSTCKTVSISDDEFEYDSLDDMREGRGATVRKLVISGDEPPISLKLQRYAFPGVFLTAHNPTASAETAFFRTHQILDRSKRFLAYGLRPGTWMLFLWIFILQGFFTRWPELFIIHGAVVFSLVLGLFTALFGQNGSLSVISLVRRHERDSFWRRNWDKLILAAISAILGAIAREIIVWLRSSSP